MVSTIDGSLRFSKKQALLLDGLTRAASQGLAGILTVQPLKAVLPELSDYLRRPIAFSGLPALLTGGSIQKGIADESTVRTVASELMTIDIKTSGSSPFACSSVFSGLTESQMVSRKLSSLVRSESEKVLVNATISARMLLSAGDIIPIFHG